MNVVQIVQALAATSSRKDKEEIVLKAFLSGNREFFIASRLAYDVLVTFGVAKVAEILEVTDTNEGTFSFNDFINLADKLRKRELTGHAARDAINAAALACHIPTWNLFYRRVLLKDLGVGITEGTINRVLTKLAKTNPEAKDYIIPVFECQLAHNGELEEHRKYVSGKKLLDIKLDGVRLLAAIDKEKRTVTHYMRDGKVNENFPAIRDAMLPLLDILPASVMLDGEVVTENFQDLMTRLQKKGADTSSAKLALFDIIPLKDFLEGGCSTPQAARHAVLSEMETNGLFAHATNGCLYVIPKVEVDLDTPEGQKTFEEFNRAAIDADFEGIMIKDPNAPYECKRSRGWLKKKPKISVTLEVIGFEIGNPDGKFKNTLGALICRGEDEGKKIVTNCGGGFPEELRDEIWQNQDKWLGMLVEVEGDKLTLEEGSDTYSVRFPVFKGPRGRVPGEKL